VALQIYIDSVIDNRVKGWKPMSDKPVRSEADKQFAKDMIAKFKAEDLAHPKTKKELAHIARENRRWVKEIEFIDSIKCDTNIVSAILDKPKESMEVICAFSDLVEYVRADKRRNELVLLTKYVISRYVAGNKDATPPT
jgi:hypothetical protein